MAAIDFSKCSDEELARHVAAVQAANEFRKFNKRELFRPYPKQADFFGLGTTARERLLMAGNQLGKSEAGAFEVACHLTGEYPIWWPGRRWDRPVRGWAAGETSVVVRDVQQKKLCGEPGVESDFGSGFIPKDRFVTKPTLQRGASNAYDTLQVRHVSGGTSVLKFKSYEQGRQKFQADTLDFLWWDEEPPSELYSEGLARITATGGMEFMTFTPLKGRSDVVLKFLDNLSPDRAYVVMTIMDAAHISPEQRAKIIEGYEPHEREARINGVPMQGSGRVWTTPEESLAEARIDPMPQYWGKIWGVDFGISHPFAAVLMAWDKDNDVIHVMHTIRMSGSQPFQHAAAMKNVAANVPVAWPQDGTQRDKGSGTPLAEIYRKEGLEMIGVHATWPDGSISTEAGIVEMAQRMQTGRFKVGNWLSDWFEEYRFYHRENGEIVKVKDDILSATRVGIMMRRYARQVEIGNRRTRRKAIVAEGVDFPLF